MGLEKFWPDLEISCMVSLEVSFLGGFASRSLDFFKSQSRILKHGSRCLAKSGIYHFISLHCIYRLGEIFCDIKLNCDLAICN